MEIRNYRSLLYVLDLIFLEGPDVIFRVALALLTHHKEKLLHCDGFEEIMNYLKIQLANIDKTTLDKVMKQVSIIKTTHSP